MSKMLQVSVTLLLACGAFAASDDSPRPINVSHESTDLSLPLYQSLRQKVSLIGDSATAANPAAAPADDDERLAQQRLATEATLKSMEDLRGIVLENEAQILRALSSNHSLHREMAARVLVFASDRKAAVKSLIELLRDTDAEVRTASVVSLGVLGDAAAVDALIQALEDESEDVRSRASEALGLIRDDRAISKLFDILKDEPQPQVRFNAAIALARIKSGVSVDELSARMEQEPNDKVKMAIAAAIKAINGSEALPDATLDSNNFRKRLQELAGDMSGLHEKLREDRHDQVVQLDGQQVEKKLQDMIDELQKMDQVASGRPQNDTRKPTQAAPVGKAKGNGKSGAPGTTGGQSEAPVASGRTTSGEIVHRQERWSSLPPKVRDELLQVYTPDMPVRWRKRLEAYFVSLAEEEVRGMDLKRSDRAPAKIEPKPHNEPTPAP